MEKLHLYRRVIRGAATRLLTSTNELLQHNEPTAPELQAAIDALEEKGAILDELDTKISDVLDGQEFEEEIEGALNFHDRIRHAITKIRYILNEKYGLRTENTRVHAVSLPKYLFTTGAVERDCEKLVSTVELGETQTDSVEYNVAQAPEETHIEPPPCQVEYIFVPDFMKGESLPQRPKTLPEVVHEMAPMREAESFRLAEDGKSEEPSLINSAQCDETARPGRDRTEPCELTPITRTKTSESEPTEKPTRRKRKTEFGRPLYLMHQSYPDAEMWRAAQHHLKDHPYMTQRPETFEESERTLWLSSASAWRRLAFLKSARRLKHRWKQK